MRTELENELIELETQFWNSMKKKDVQAAARLADDPCIVTRAQGVAQIEKTTFVKMMESGNWTLHDFRIDEAKVQRLSADVAIIGYKVHEELTVDGKPVALDAVDASTWVKKNGRWVCAMHTESILGDPYGRDRSSSGRQAESAEGDLPTNSRPASATPDLKAAAVDFMRKVAAGEVGEAYARYVSPTFRHHNPFFRGDAQSLREAMQENAQKNPNKIFEIQRALQEGDLVAVHSRVRQNPQDRGGAVVHLFRFSENRIEELWDIGQPAPEKMVNEHGMF